MWAIEHFGRKTGPQTKDSDSLSVGAETTTRPNGTLYIQCSKCTSTAGSKLPVTLWVIRDSDLQRTAQTNALAPSERQKFDLCVDTGHIAQAENALV
jgi:hypothetical protein